MVSQILHQKKTRSLRDYADDVLALLDHLNIEKFSVIGLSVGECGALSWH